jgi:hypothetical protein
MAVPHHAHGALVPIVSSALLCAAGFNVSHLQLVGTWLVSPSGMPPADLGTTNVWLALIAISSFLQLLIAIAILVGSYRFYRRMEKTVDRISDELIAPVSARAHKFIDEAEELMERARSFDDGVRRTLSRVGDGVGIASAVVKSRFWPVIGLLRGVKAGLSSFAQRPAATNARRPRAKVTRLTPKNASDVEAEQRFAYEGGTTHARS